jgi:hypothetical protein
VRPMTARAGTAVHALASRCGSARSRLASGDGAAADRIHSDDDARVHAHASYHRNESSEDSHSRITEARKPAAAAGITNAIASSLIARHAPS